MALIQQYSQPFFITPQMFGATGNGATDDTAAIKAAMSAAAAFGDGASIYFNPGTYVISSPIPFNASMQGVSNECVTIEASSSFSGSYMLDFNSGHGGQRISEIYFDLNALGSAGTVTTFGSSSTYGGGGPALVIFDHVVVTSDSLTVPAVQMASSGTESGAFTGSVWLAPYISAPMPIAVGQNQDDVVFHSPRFICSGGAISSVPISFAGSDINLLSPYLIMVGDTPSGISAIVNIGPNSVSIYGGFMESSVSLTNAIWGFQCISTGRLSAPQAHFQIYNLELNVAYGGSSPDQALIRINIPSSSNNSFHISIDGLTLSSGGNSPWNTLFDIYNGSASASGPVYLTIKDVDEATALTISATGSTNSGTNVVAQLQGYWRGKILNHTAPAPTAGTRYSWTWVNGASFGPD